MPSANSIDETIARNVSQVPNFIAFTQNSSVGSKVAPLTCTSYIIRWHRVVNKNINPIPHQSFPDKSST